MPFYVVLDACVLYPYSLRDTLLRCAEAELYAPLWSARILDEMQRNVVANGACAQAVVRTRELLQVAFDGACIPEEQIAALESVMTNDARDRHVLAAAVAAHADVLVTANLKHSPPQATAIHRIDVQSPDEFLIHLHDLDPPTVAAVLAQ